MSYFKSTPQSAIEKSVHRRILGTLAIAAWISVSVVLLSPLALIGPLKSDYISILQSGHDFIRIILYSNETLFTTITFGIVAASIAMYALTGQDRSRVDGSEFIERELLGVYVSRINFVLSVVFGLLLFLEMTIFFTGGLQLGPAYTVVSTLMGFFICGFLAGFHIRGEYLKTKSLNESLYLLNWLNGKVQQRPASRRARFGFSVLALNVAVSGLFAVAGSVSLIAIGLPLSGVVAGVTFSLLYCSILVYMLFEVRASAWDTRTSGRASLSLMRFVSVLVSIMIISSEITLASYFMKIDTFGKLVGIALVWLTVILVTWFYWVASDRYRATVRDKQLRIIKNRIDATEKSVAIMKQFANVSNAEV